MTQHIYIRRGRAPVFESAITIHDADKPIGTFVFTALSYTKTPGRMQWNVVSMYKNATDIEPYSKTKHGSNRRRPPQPADVSGARNALRRLVIPQEAIDHIIRLPLPGASLIVSDEEPSNETGQDTDFIVFMSGEPQGGATSRVAFVNEEDGPGWSEQSQGHKRGSSFSRSNPDAAGENLGGRRYFTFPDLFGF
jgi:hypothetical protein